VSLTHRTAVKDLAAGVYAALSTSTFTALAPIFRVYVPDGQVKPYAVLHNFTENRSGDFESMGSPTKDCTFQIDVVSQSRGEAEASDILNAGVGIVMRGFFGSTEAPLTVANHRLLLMEYEGSDGFSEADDAGVEEFHRVGRFRAQLEQST
jgi:hypothetical protein